MMKEKAERARTMQTAAATREVPETTQRRSAAGMRSTPMLSERWLFSRVVIMAPAKVIQSTR